jgi:hypothetical protein
MKDCSNMSFDEMRAELFKEMDATCKKHNITRDELINQIEKHGERQNKKQGNIRVSKIK